MSAIIEQRTPSSPPVRLLRLAQAEGSFPDPPIGEVSIQLVTAGTFHTRYDVGGGWIETAASRGMIGVAPAEEACVYETSGDYEFLIVNLSAAWLQSALEEDLPGFDGRYFGQIHNGMFRDAWLARSMTALWKAGEAHGGLQRAALEHGALTLALALLQRSGTSYEVVPQVQRGGLAPRQLRRVNDLIEAEMAGDLPLTRFAGTVGLSVTHFARAFRQATGVTPHLYLMQRRVDRAARLLSKTTAPIGAVAIQCGFADAGHLAKWTARLLNRRPRDLR